MDVASTMNMLQHQGWAVEHTPSVDALVCFARRFGKPVPSRRNSAIIDILTPRDKDSAHPRSMSAIYGKGPFPFHTDGAYFRLPPRYVFLRGTKKDTDCPTLISSMSALWASPELTRRVKHSVWVVSDGRQAFYSSPIHEQQNKKLLRFDNCCMKPASAAFADVSDLLEQAATNSGVEEVYWEEGLTLVLDNWRVFHARPDVTHTSNRKLERVFVCQGEH